MVKLVNKGKSADFGTAFDVIHDGVKVGVAYRAESGKNRGIYSFGDLRNGGFSGSRARLIAHVEAR